MSAAVSSITRQTVGKTFIVAVSALGVGAAWQIGVIIWLFLARFHAGPVAGAGGPAAVSGPLTVTAKDFADPFAEAFSPNGSTPTAPPAPPRPAPLSREALNHPEVSTEATPEDRLNELLEQGRLLRDRGDTYAAVTKLREAQVLDPKNPAPWAELAMTYEKMGFAEKAAENWKRIYDMGEAAGVYYAAAEGKLKTAKSQMIGQSHTAEGEGANPGAASATGAGDSSEALGIGPGSRLGLKEITRTDENDPQAVRKLTLHVPIKAKARARIEAHDVTVQVIFYDVLNNRTLEKTRANVSYRWAQPGADWTERDVETLEVTYSLARPPQGEPLEDRKYYGYTASVYYKNALQDFHADPPRLAQQSPPPRTLTTENSP